MLYNEEAVPANIRNREGKRIFYLGKGDQLTSAARDYLSRERIEIRPGEQAKQDCPACAAPVGRNNLLRRGLAEPEEISAPVIFLASQAGAYLTGAVIPVAGGVTA